MYGNGAGNIFGTRAGSGGAKAKVVADNTARNLLDGKIGDGTEVIVRDATTGPDADPTVLNPNLPGARYRYNKDGDPATWEKIAEEESLDVKLYATLPDSAVTTQAYGDIAVGTTWGTIKDREINSLLLDFLFKTVHYEYTEPVTNLNDVSTTKEVGESFNVALTASITKNDGGDANRVIIKKDGATVQDTALPTPLDYTYDDNAVELNDGEQVQYQSTIHYDQGDEQNDTSGKGLVSPGRIEAGSDDSPVRIINVQRKVFYDKSVAAPADSAAIRALGNWQYANDLTLLINLIDGDSDIVVAMPDHLTLSNVTFNGVLPLDQTTEMLATEQIIAVEGGGPGYIKNYRVYRLAPESAYTASSYSITLKAV